MHVSIFLYIIQLLVEHEEALAPEPSDPLRDILKDLGAIPSVEALLGIIQRIQHTCTCTILHVHKCMYNFTCMHVYSFCPCM